MSGFTNLIGSDFKQLHIDMITEVIRSCSVTCTVTFGVTLYDDCPNCWESGTLIRTEHGYKPIEDITIGELVYNNSNSLNRVKDTRSRFSNENLYNLSCWSASLPHRVTANHKFPVVKNMRSRYKQREWYDPGFRLDISNMIEEVSAKDISIDDALIIPYTNHSATDMTDWNGYEVDDDLLYLFGWWIAEGCLSISKYTRSGAFCLCASDEEHVANKLQSILRNKFGITSRLEWRKDADNLLVNWNSSSLAKLMIQFGHRAENKVIPSDLWSCLSLRQKEILLLAYTDGDGNVFSNTDESIYSRVSITTVSEKLALQVFDILISLGYYPSINWQEEHIDKNKVHHQRCYSVVWCQDRIQQKSNVRKTNVGLLVKIRKIEVEDNCSTLVHNLEIDDVHQYVAGTFLTCNCIFDPIGNKSSNRHIPGGPAPFTVGQCPMCAGVGKIPNEQTSTLSLAPIYDYKGWIPGITSNVRSPGGFVQTISAFSTYDTLRQAKEVIMDTAIDSSTRARFERYGEPEPCGIGASSFVLTMWKRIENG